MTEVAGSVAALYFDGAAERDRLLGIAREKGGLTREEVRFKKKDGGWFWASMSLRPVRIEGHAYWLAIVEDVTGTKQAMEEREGYLKELERLTRVMVDREGQMIKLKERIRVLEEKKS